MHSTIVLAALALIATCRPPDPPPDSGNDSGGDAPSVTDTASDSPAPTCSLEGSWRGTIPGGAFAGQAMTWTFAAGGNWNGVWGSATVAGTWTVTGSTATLTDTSAMPAYVAYPSDQRGTYELAFSASCATVTWHATGDVCDGRRLAVDTITVTRQ